MVNLSLIVHIDVTNVYIWEMSVVRPIQSKVSGVGILRDKLYQTRKQSEDDLNVYKP